LIDDWFEGAATSAGESQLRAHIKSCPACRAEFQALDLLRQDLETIGDTLSNREPLPSIAPAVMAAISKAKPAKIRPVAPRPFLRRLIPWLVLPVAAAAVVLVFVASSYRNPAVHKSLVAKTARQAPNGKDASSVPAAVKRDVKDPAVAEQVEQVKNLALDSLILTDNKKPATESVEAVSNLSLNDVLGARRDALSDPDARAALAQWASLTVEQARKLISGAADTAGELGAALMLPPDEAQPILTAAVQENDDPYLKYRLATSYSKTPETAPKAAAQYAQLAVSDSGNALAKYQYAASCFAQGDATNGLDALSDAQQIDGLNAYTSTAAKYREQALIAAGASPEVARAIAAFVAGNEEYGQLVDLGNQLLEYGKYYEQNGDSETAQQIYEAVRMFGTQVNDNATYASEQLAGLDVERAAVEMLSNLVSFIGVPENLQMIANETGRLLESFANVGQFITTVNDFFSQDQNSALMRLAVDYLFQNGDLGLLDYVHSQSGNNR
jgi:hypothetical protein